MSTDVIDGGAPAPAAPLAAPIPEAEVSHTNALGTQTPPAVEKPEVKPEAPKTAGEAVRVAMDKVKERQAAELAKDAPQKPGTEAKPAVEAKEPAKPVADRAPDGKFAPKSAPEGQQSEPSTEPQRKAEPGTIHEAPQRFDTASKAEWANVPESVKGAVHRTLRELETGIEEHRQRWEPIKRYDDMAKQYNTDLPSALERYVAMDSLLAEDLTQGIDSIIRDKTGGQMGLRDFIGQVVGQQPDQAQSQSEATIHRLTSKIAELERHIGGVSQHIQQQSSKAIETDVVAFSEGKADFEALAPKIAEHIKAGKDLPTAYETARQEMADIARQLGFVPANTTQQPLSPAPQAQPLKPAGQKSITGAPSSGSDPASTARNPNAPIPSIRDALKRGMARAGA